MSDASWFDRPVLAGKHVRLEPLAAEHAEGLFRAGADPAVWTWLNLLQPSDVAGASAQIDAALAQYERRERLPYALVVAGTGEIAGTTSFYDLAPAHRGLCVGHTWVGTPWQRTALNTEAKLLLLTRAFDELGALRVCWHTHSRNARSRAAIERLGGRFEGIVRKDKIRPDGSVRDTAQYSMIDEEWPAAKAALAARLAG